MATDLFKSLTVRYREGERIVAAGERGGCMFVVQGGEVRLLRPSNGKGAPVEVARLAKGDFFGEGAILEGKPYAVDAEAHVDAEIVEISASTLQRMLDANPEIAVRLLRKLAARLDRLEARLVSGGVGLEEAASAPVAAPEAAPEAAPAATPKVPPVAADYSGPRLVAEEGDVVFPLHGDEMLIGRYDPVTEIQPEIDLSPLDTKRSVSRRHARLTKRKGVWYLSEEVGALNGTFVNGVKLLAGRGAPISDGDTLSLGMVRVIYHAE